MEQLKYIKINTYRNKNKEKHLIQQLKQKIKINILDNQYMIIWIKKII